METEEKFVKMTRILYLVLGVLIVATFCIALGIRMILPATDSAFLITLTKIHKNLVRIMPIIAVSAAGILVLETGNSWLE